MQTKKCLSRRYVTFVTCTYKPIAVMHFLTTRFAEFKPIVFKGLITINMINREKRIHHTVYLLILLAMCAVPDN